MAAAVEQLHHAAAVEVGNDSRELLAATVVGLVERQSPRGTRRATHLELVLRADPERAPDLVAARALLARHLGVRRPAAHPLQQAPPEASRDPLALGQLGVRLAERPPTTPAAVAPLAPHQIGHAPSERQIADAHPRAVLDVERGAPTVGAAAGSRDQLDLEVDPVANLDNALHFDTVQPDETGKVILRPLFLLAPRSMTTQSLQRAADVSLASPLNPGRSARPQFSTGLDKGGSKRGGSNRARHHRKDAISAARIQEAERRAKGWGGASQTFVQLPCPRSVSTHTLAAASLGVERQPRSSG